MTSRKVILKTLAPHIKKRCGDNLVLLESAHHGLQEIAFTGLYPHLNLDELITIAAGSWQIRDRLWKNGQTYTVRDDVVDTVEDLLSRRLKITQYSHEHGTATKPYDNAEAWFSERWKKVAGANDSVPDPELYKQFNPFGEDDSLQARLYKVHDKVAKEFLKSLEEPTRRYEFSIDANVARQEEGHAKIPRRVEEMRFHRHRKTKKMKDDYATEIAKKVRAMPSSYSPLSMLDLEFAQQREEGKKQKALHRYFALRELACGCGPRGYATQEELTGKQEQLTLL